MPEMSYLRDFLMKYTAPKIDTFDQVHETDFEHTAVHAILWLLTVVFACEFFTCASRQLLK